MIHEGSLGLPVSWWGMTHAHTFHDQPSWNRTTAAKLRANLVMVPVPELFRFIHQCVAVASLLIICAVLCTGPQWSTHKKGFHTFIITACKRRPSACSHPACTHGFSAHDGRSPSLGWPHPGGPRLRWASPG